ncbi:MAG TPA: integrin alpha [Phycisphaerae bacterium]|nr:integrin alpha [Phycisphaerae bacterium]
MRPLALLGVLVSVAAGLTCPGEDDGLAPLNPPVTGGNTPPRVLITSISTDFGNNFAEVGEIVQIAFTGEDAEDTATVRIFASTAANPTPAEEIPILSGFPVGPGVGSGLAQWDTTGLIPGGFNIFAEISDGVNAPVRVLSASQLQLGPVGSRPPTSPPQLVFLSPLPSLSISANDELTIQYIFADVDSTALLTLLLDKDVNPFNDDVDNPGSPLDPSSKIIILPSAARLPLDPTFDGDPPPPGTPEDPIEQPDSLEIRTNPRVLVQTIPGQLPFPGAPLAGDEKAYVFRVNFSEVPPRTSPYFIRATLNDGDNVRHVYAPGSLSINGSANGTIDISKIGFDFAGARFAAFQSYANLGNVFVRMGDLDFDGVGEFVIGSRFASPRGRRFSGAAYLIYGRSKLPFPADTDGDGRPDGGRLDANDNVINYPEPPGYLTNPYNPGLVGRYGGVLSVESAAGTPSSHIRGTIYVMPKGHVNESVPPHLGDPSLPTAPTLPNSAGLTSIARVNVTGNDAGVEGVPEGQESVPDLVFGLPFIAGARDFQDDDPSDGCDGDPYGDGLPNQLRCSDVPDNDQLFFSAGFEDPGRMGLVAIADATNNTVEDFPKFVDAGMAGQFDEDGNLPITDEGVTLNEDLGQVPRGVRLRGGWLADIFSFVNNGFFDDTGFGQTVSNVQSVDNDDEDDLLISIPFLDRDDTGDTVPDIMDCGGFQVWLTDNYIAPFRYEDGVRSLPAYGTCAAGTCLDTMPPLCIRCLNSPVFFTVFGEQAGDQLGNATNGGDLNADGNSEIMAGAPRADRNGFTDNGVAYVVYTLGSGFFDATIESDTITSLRLFGTHDDDQFGRVQGGVQSMTTAVSTVNDAIVASDFYDDPVKGVNAGFVGVIFARAGGFVGNRTVDEIATATLPGVRFIGATAGARAGAHASSAGDFNGDGLGDLLIASPGETRQGRVGVAYLVFGGPHLCNRTFYLDQVGTAALPGIVFLPRTLEGTGAETIAALETVAGVGDVDGDQFGDIIIGSPKADYVDPLLPSERLIDAGEVYLIYGNNFAGNNPSTFPPASPDCP